MTASHMPLATLLTLTLGACAQAPAPHADPETGLGALRPSLTLTIQGLTDQNALATRLTGTPASGAAPAIPGLTQMLTAVAALPAPASASAPNVRFVTQAKPSGSTLPDCQPVLVTSPGVSPSPVTPTTVQPVTLMFNAASLYLEGFARAGQYYYFTDTPDCARLWPAGKSTKFTFASTHLSAAYSMNASSVSKAVEALGKSGTATADLQKALDQLSFAMSEALRFSSVMAVIAAGGNAGKTEQPEVNSWAKASEAYATLARTGALPTPAPSAEVRAALSVLSTAQYQ